MGKALKPEAVVVVRDLPKTRSGKLMRRVARAAYLGTDPGDLSALDNPLRSRPSGRGEGETARGARTISVRMV